MCINEFPNNGSQMQSEMGYCHTCRAKSLSYEKTKFKNFMIDEAALDFGLNQNSFKRGFV